MTRECTALLWLSICAPLFCSAKSALAEGVSRPAATPAPFQAALPNGVDDKQSAASAPALDSAATERAALAAYEQAASAYASGDTPRAFEAMRESYRLSKRPELLYNLARLERELQRCKASLADYTLYLQSVPDGQYRAEAEQARRELELECSSNIPASVTAPADPVSAPDSKAPPAEVAHVSRPAPAYWTTTHLIAWSLISSGVLAGGGALYFRFAARAARDDVQASVNAQVMGGPHWNEGRQGDQHRDMNFAGVLAVASGALVTSGALVLVLGPHSDAGEQPNASLAILPNAVQGRYCFHF